MDNQYGVFPFEFVSFENQKCSFIQNVEAILKTNLQESDSFGCKISNCHTHVGSKVHFEDFVEAELLFHNNYYNYGFAFLTVERIISEVKKNKEKKNVVLIGYESYSELYLQQVQTLLKKHSFNISCEYCVFETVAKTIGEERTTLSQIRNLVVDKDEAYIQYGYFKETNKKLNLADTLFVFVVPINTTLSTMDKMISHFKRECGIYKNIDNSSMKCLSLCLITIGSIDYENHYWKIENPNSFPVYLSPQRGRFVELGNIDPIETFSFIESKWTYTRNVNKGQNRKFAFCNCCYPDVCKDKEQLKTESIFLKEKPIFDVTRGSVVPMLQLGKKEHLKPVDFFEGIRNEENLKRVWQISGHMAYKHMIRGDNHFQFYFDADGFLSQYDKEVKEYLKSISMVDENDSDGTVIYNYIVAPRQKTNAKWVNYVYSYVFSEESNNTINSSNQGARILYFDVTKEYRSNLKAKYSDFYRAIDNISRSGQRFELRFHYVDETIASGSSFIRASDLIRSLLLDSNIENNSSGKISVALFYSIFLLYGRASQDSMRFYYNLFKNAELQSVLSKNANKHFYEYVHINISQMRNYEDACTLCKLVNDYRKIQKYCGTNMLANVCSDFITDHAPHEISFYKDVNAQNVSFKENNSFHCSMEKRYLFLITHILNSRFSSNNGPLFCKKNASEKIKLPIDVESEKSPEYILQVMKDYYCNLFKWLVSNNIINLSRYCEEHFPKRDTYSVGIEIHRSSFSSSSSLTRIKKEQEESFKNAFIKAISRPFFIFHLRKRQASFTFCLEELHKMLTIPFDTEYEERENVLRRMQSLVKALADMNANYLIRSTKEFSPFESLLKWAKLGDDFDVTHHSKLFNSKQLQSYIKKMLSLTQDTTKSLLFEHILVNGKEDGFFGKIISDNISHVNSFLNNTDITVKGIIYLENNRIIKDALKDFYLNGDLMDSLPYYLDNFKNICEINGYNILENRKNFSKTYKDVVNYLSDSDSKTQDEGDLDLKLNKWLQSIVKEMSVISFVYDSMNANDPNHLFDLFMLSNSSNKNEPQSFYYDDHIKIILEQITCAKNRNTDIIFFENSVLVKYMENEHSNGCIYLEIKGFSRDKILCWFALKLLLTLRSNFAEYIHRINLPVMIKAKSEEMRKKALRLNKAVTHSASKSFMRPDIYLNNDANPLDSYYGQLRQNGQVPYDKYFQIIANEMVSHMYRTIVRCESKPLQSGKNDIPVVEIQEELKKTFFEDENGKYKINCFHDGKIKTIYLNFSFLHENDANNLFFKRFHVFNGRMEALVLLTWIMAMNVAEHGKGDTLNVCFEKTGIKFSNDCEKINKEIIEKYTNIPPWHFEDSNSHITLWAFKHFLNDNFMYSIDNKKGLFTIFFQVFYYKD